MPKKERLSPEEFSAKQENYNNSIASSLARILRLSLNSEFRTQCFQLMKVDNTNDFETAVNKELDKQALLVPEENLPDNVVLEVAHEVVVPNVIPSSSNELANTNKNTGEDAMECDKNSPSTSVPQDGNSKLNAEEDLEDREFWKEDKCFQWNQEELEQKEEIVADDIVLDDATWN